MSFLVFLKFAVKSFDILAWPLFALVYPLCASIRAIESGSNMDIRKLVNYWVLFTLIYLFDHAFERLLEWLPFWPYVKLVAIFWLEVPHFDGSFYVYENFVRPCLSVNPYIIIQRCNKRKEEFFVNRENFLVAAEQYVKENGPEALERLIASKYSNPTVDVEEIKAFAAADKKELDQCSKPNVDVKEIKAAEATEIEVDQCKEPNVVQKKSKAMEVTEKRELAAELQCKKCDVTQKETRAADVREKKEGTSVNWVNQTTPSLAQTENQTFSSAGTKETATITGSDGKLPTVTSSSNIQKEWACGLCQVTTQSETVYMSHLQGKKHRAAFEKLKAENQYSNPTLDVEEIKAFAAAEKKELDQCKEPNVVQKKSKAMEVTEKRELAAELQCKKSDVIQKETKAVDVREKKEGTSVNWVNQTTPSLAQTENQTFSSAGTKETVTITGSDGKLPPITSSSNIQKEWVCALCQVTAQCETVYNSHLQGKKHRAALEKLKAKNLVAENKCSPALTPMESDQTKKNVSGIESTQKNVGKQEEKVRVSGKQQINANKTGVTTKQTELWCNICNITCPGEPQMDAHLKGKKHLALIQKLNDCAEY